MRAATVRHDEALSVAVREEAPRENKHPEAAGDRTSRPADEPYGDEWLQIPDLAERIGLSKEAVYRLARKGQLPGAVKLGRRYVINYTVFRTRSLSMTDATSPYFSTIA